MRFVSITWVFLLLPVFNEQFTGLLQVEEIFAFGVQRFGNSAWMHLLRAQHSFFYHENKTVALSHLARAESRSPHLDESFSIYFLRKSAHVRLAFALHFCVVF